LKPGTANMIFSRSVVSLSTFFTGSSLNICPSEPIFSVSYCRSSEVKVFGIKLLRHPA
jgi:hypothetical protein